MCKVFNQRYIYIKKCLRCVYYKAPWEDSSDEDLEVHSFSENNQSDNDDDFYD